MANAGPSGVGWELLGSNVAHQPSEWLTWSEALSMGPKVSPTRGSGREPASSYRVASYNATTGGSSGTAGQPSASSYGTLAGWADAMGAWADALHSYEDPLGGGGRRFECPTSFAAQRDCTLDAEASCIGPTVGAGRDGCATGTALVAASRIWFRAAEPGAADLMRRIIEPMTLAWCLVLDNVDLIQWAAELVKGPAAGETMSACLEFAGLNVFVVDTNVTVFATVPLSAWIPYFLGTGGMHLIADVASGTWDAWLTLYEGGDDDTRMCVLVDLASILAHETAHGCGVHLIDLGAGDCRAAYRIGNTVKMGLLERYPAAMRASCCQVTYSASRAAGDTSVDESLLFTSNEPLALRRGTGC